MKRRLEIAPCSDQRLTYDEAIMYCFVLEFDGKGWRLPTLNEYIVHYDRLYACWHEGIEDKKEKLRVIPVRDKPL